MIKYSLITSEIPDILTKTLSLDENGKLLKISGGQMSRGKVEIKTIERITDFAVDLLALQKNQALCYGIPLNMQPGQTRTLVSEKNKVGDAISRTTKDFAWDDGPGVFFLDHDDDLTDIQFMMAVSAAVPQLGQVDSIWWPSSSSHIFHNENDTTGLKGQRLYFLVNKATDIPRIGKILHRRLWLAGLGKIVISRAGSLLERSVVDATVWQCNRLDFAAGAYCKKPLEQRRGEPVFFAGGSPMINTSEIVDLTEAEEDAYNKLVMVAKAELKPRALEVQAQHIEERLAAVPESDRPRLREVYRNAYSSGMLSKSFQVTLFVDGIAEIVSVDRLLKNREKYHGCVTLDPIEPEYGNFHKTGIVYLKDDTPNLYSLAHGGKTYYLIDKEISVPSSDSTVQEGFNKLHASLDAQKRGELITLPFPWRRLSAGSKALRPGSLTILSGPSKTGKSYFTMSIIRHIQELGHSWAYLPLEDDRNDWILRMLAILEEDYKMTDADQEGADHRQQVAKKREAEVKEYLRHVTENPYAGKKDENGKTAIKKVDGSRVLAWIARAVKKARVVVVDPLSQIEFSGKNKHEEEAAFVRQILGVVKDSGASLILVTHTIKRSGAAAALDLTAEDVQGSAMLTRLAHTTIILDAHELCEREVSAPGGNTTTVMSNRTVTIAVSRFGDGSRSRIAFRQEQNRPAFTELGFIVAKKKKK